MEFKTNAEEKTDLDKVEWELSNLRGKIDLTRERVEGILKGDLEMGETIKAESKEFKQPNSRVSKIFQGVALMSDEVAVIIQKLDIIRQVIGKNQANKN